MTSVAPSLLICLACSTRSQSYSSPNRNRRLSIKPGTAISRTAITRTVSPSLLQSFPYLQLSIPFILSFIHSYVQSPILLKIISTMFRKCLLRAAALFAGASLASDCDSGTWNAASFDWVGGNGGTPYRATNYKSGIIITSIQAWVSSSVVEAIQFGYSDGTISPQFGQVQAGTHKGLSCDLIKDSINMAKLHGNGQGTRLGHIKITTSPEVRLMLTSLQMVHRSIRQTSNPVSCWAHSETQVKTLTASAFCF